GCEKRCGPILILPTNHRHRKAQSRRGLIIGPVRVAQHTLHLSGQPKKVELHLEMRKAVARRQLVVMNPVVLFRYGNNIHPNLHNLIYGQDYAIGVRYPLQCDVTIFGSPLGQFSAVQPEPQVVRVLVPFVGRGCLHGEVVGPEAEAQGLNPGVVSGPARGPVAYEAGVDMEVFVRDECEVLIFLAVEVEDTAVRADEPAHWRIAIYVTSFGLWVSWGSGRALTRATNAFEEATGRTPRAGPNLWNNKCTYL
ncbi:adenosine monophosphate-protein transferase FICD homolog, partial [Striga asiatica]